MFCLDWKTLYDYWKIISTISVFIMILGFIKRKALKEAIAYCEDFCTYRRKWKLQLSFENHFLEEGFNYFSLRCVNRTAYNIRVTRIYTEKSVLEIGHYFYQQGTRETYYKNLQKQSLQSSDLSEYIDLDLSPVDTAEKRSFLNGYSESKNETKIKIRFRGEKTKIFVEYEIKNIQPSFFLSNKRSVKVMIPI